MLTFLATTLQHLASLRVGKCTSFQNSPVVKEKRRRFFGGFNQSCIVSENHYQTDQACTNITKCPKPPDMCFSSSRKSTNSWNASGTSSSHLVSELEICIIRNKRFENRPIEEARGLKLEGEVDMTVSFNYLVMPDKLMKARSLYGEGLLFLYCQKLGIHRCEDQISEMKTFTLVPHYLSN